jgi:hypothetical protein
LRVSAGRLPISGSPTTRLRPPSHPTRWFALQRLAVGAVVAVQRLDVDAGVVLRETGHVTSAIDGHPELVDPAGQEALDVLSALIEHVDGARVHTFCDWHHWHADSGQLRSPVVSS